jgi:alpha-glucosidase
MAPPCSTRCSSSTLKIRIPSGSTLNSSTETPSLCTSFPLVLLSVNLVDVPVLDLSSSPVTGENAVSVTIYLPKDNFYDFLTYAPIQGTGSTVYLSNVPFTSIPVYIRGGSVIPLRQSSANTTAQLRQLDFEIVIAPGVDGSASGNLYIDDGVSITQTQPNTWVSFSYKSGTLTASGTFASTNKVATVSFLGVSKAPKAVQVNGQRVSSYSYDSGKKVVKAAVSIPLSAGFTVGLA